MGKSHVRDIFVRGRPSLGSSMTDYPPTARAPGTDMDFVDGHRSRQRVMIHPLFHPISIIPLIRQVPHDRRRFGGISL